MSNSRLSKGSMKMKNKIKIRKNIHGKFPNKELTGYYFWDTTLLTSTRGRFLGIGHPILTAGRPKRHEH